MANLTNRYEKLLADGLTGVTPLTTPTTVYLAGFTADPTESGSVANELSGSGYARKALTGLFSASSDGTTANTTQIDFTTATGDWTQVTHVGYMESGVATTDDMMVWSALDSPITILDTGVFSFAIGVAIINVL